MKKSGEKAARNSDPDYHSHYPDPDSDSEPSTEAEWCISRKKWPTIVKILDHARSLFQWILKNWKRVFVTSCVFAVLLDPLFLYIPMIKQNMSCVSLDNNLKITALTLRSFTDIFYLMDIILQIYTSDEYSMRSLINKFDNSSFVLFLCNTFLPTVAKTIWRSYILIDIFAVLPIPQVLILSFFSKLRASRSLGLRKFVMNFLVLMQYVPRVLRFYILCKEPSKNSTAGPWGETSIWVKGVLNFFLYILSSHVLGALWYFFSIQRMTSCWQHACRKENNCDSTSFDCQLERTFRNITFLNDNLCPISQPNVTIFNFGIYVGLLQSDLPGSTNFLQKFLNCFCWGLRNLSSLGSNLDPSTNTWENLFVVFISIIGLLLFIYLIGNLQTYLSLDTTRIEEHRRKMKTKRRMKEKEQELQSWLSKNGIPAKTHKAIKSQILEKIEEQLEVDIDFRLDDVLSILPEDLEKEIKRCMPLTKLMKVRALENMEPQVLKEICGRLQSMNYARNKLIIPENEPLKMMVFIVTGEVAIKMKDGSVSTKGPGHLCGENLLAWPFSTTLFPQTLPTATESVTASDDVEALILMESDMKSVASKFQAHFIKKYRKLKDIFTKRLSPVSLHIPSMPAVVMKRTKQETVVRAAESSYCYDKRTLFDDYETQTVDLGARTTVMSSSNATIPEHDEATKKEFTAQELKKATKNYHVSMIVGEGGYGIVYKGTLADGRIVAVKKSKRDAPKMQSQRSVNEAVVLSQITHTNIVQLLGCCLETKMPIMVYEFIGHGTLYEHIHNKEKWPAPLSLESRIKIAAGIAGAIEHLHHTKFILHRDVKTMNILLDENYTAKLSGFGASKLRREDEDEGEDEENEVVSTSEDEDEENEVVSTSEPGTLGYLDPEYLQTKMLDESSDVYSFGVVLAELITGRRALSIETDEDADRSLANFFVSAVEDGCLEKIVDGDILKKEGSFETVKQVSDVAVRCLKLRGKERPTMIKVSTELGRIKWQSSNAKQPSPPFGSNYFGSPSSSIDISSNIAEVDDNSLNNLVFGHFGSPSFTPAIPLPSLFTPATLPIPSSFPPAITFPSLFTPETLPIPSSFTPATLPIPSSFTPATLPIPSSFTPAIPLPSLFTPATQPIPSSFTPAIPLPSLFAPATLPIPSSFTPAIPFPSLFSPATLPIPPSFTPAITLPTVVPEMKEEDSKVER